MKIANLIKIVFIILFNSILLFAENTELKVINLQNNKSITVHIDEKSLNKELYFIPLSSVEAKEIGLFRANVTQKVEKPSAQLSSVEMATLEKRMLEDDLKDNPYLSSKDEKSMQEYALESTARTATQSVSVTKVQIAAFNSEKSAKNFVAKVNTNGFNMDIVKHEINNKLFYKVVILCPSKNEAHDLLESKQYAGAYVLR